MIEPSYQITILFTPGVVQAFECWFSENLTEFQNRTVYKGQAKIKTASGNKISDCEIYFVPESKSVTGETVSRFATVAVFIPDEDVEISLMGINVESIELAEGKSRMQKILANKKGSAK